MGRPLPFAPHKSCVDSAERGNSVKRCGRPRLLCCYPCAGDAAPASSRACRRRPRAPSPALPLQAQIQTACHLCLASQTFVALGWRAGAAGGKSETGDRKCRHALPSSGRGHPACRSLSPSRRRARRAPKFPSWSPSRSRATGAACGTTPGAPASTSMASRSIPACTAISGRTARRSAWNSPITASTAISDSRSRHSRRVRCCSITSPGAPRSAACASISASQRRSASSSTTARPASSA
jgi:hypothetical protein